MTFETRLKVVKSALETADVVLIGAGAGFSAAAGLTYSGSRFTDNFQPFIKKYGMTDMYPRPFTLSPSLSKNGHTGQSMFGIIAGNLILCRCIENCLIW